MLAGMPSNNGSKMKAVLHDVLEDPAVQADAVLKVRSCCQQRRVPGGPLASVQALSEAHVRIATPNISAAL